jgi:hypothetical protein
MKPITLLTLLTLSLAFFPQGYAEISDLRVSELYSFEQKNQPDRSIETFKGGFNELISYVQPSPAQGDAGTCLFMAHTGVLEWWLNKLYQPAEPIMLSSRYFINLSTGGVGTSHVQNWRTDTVLRVNQEQVFFENESFRFTKDWFKRTAGSIVPASANEPDAAYGPNYNWIAELETLGAPDFTIPEFRREIIFADPESNQWNLNIAPRDIVDQVKHALTTKKAPVVVMYNHYGYWHVSVIFGFNDHATSRGCPFVSGFPEYKLQQAESWRRRAQEEIDETERARLNRRADDFERRGRAIEQAYNERGGCRGKGVFYVRDSLYPDSSMPIYDYDLTRVGEEEHLNAPLIFREYEWLEHLSNHIFQIFPVGSFDEALN